LYNDDAAVTTTDPGSDQPTHQLDSARETARARYRPAGDGRLGLMRIIVTGGNSGVGKATAGALDARATAW
jgi:Mrp family chromosome partitioning ATPase